MKISGLLLIAVATPAAAVQPGVANTPSSPPPPLVSISPPTAPPTVINAVTGEREPGTIIAVPPKPGTPGRAYLPIPFPKSQPTPQWKLVQGPQARLPAQQVITAADYPASARAMSAQGQVGFVLTVGVDGRVADCTVTRSSGSAALDSATCRLMRSRGRFTPARDSTGNPVVATIADQVEWRLP
jgi:protein TonB